MAPETNEARAGRAQRAVAGASSESPSVAFGPRVCALAGCLFIFAAVACMMFYHGPRAVVRDIVKLLPKDPGWGHCVGLIFITVLSITMVMPIWPPLCMIAGLLFGFWKGWCMNAVSIYGAALLSFILGRTVLREPVCAYLEGGSLPHLSRIMKMMEDEDDALRLQICFRFLVIPMGVRNYAPAILQIPFWKLCVGCVPHTVWISLLFASLGATFKDTAALIRDGGEFSFSRLRWQQGLIFTLSFTMTVLLAVHAWAKFSEQMPTDEEQPDEASAVLGHRSQAASRSVDYRSSAA